MALIIPPHYLFALELQRRDVLDVREGVLHYPVAAARRRLTRERKRLDKIIRDNPWLSDLVVAFDSDDGEKNDTPGNVLKMVEMMLLEKIYRISASEYLEASYHVLHVFYVCQVVIDAKKEKT